MEKQEKQVITRIYFFSYLPFSSLFSPILYSCLFFGTVVQNLRVLMLKYKARTSQDIKKDNVVMSQQ